MRKLREKWPIYFHLLFSSITIHRYRKKPTVIKLSLESRPNQSRSEHIAVADPRVVHHRMEKGGDGSESGSSYTYWVREATEQAAPLPLPKKLTSDDIISDQSKPATLGSVWNKAGTWEEKNLNKWASSRIKELLVSVESLEFSGGKAEITEVSNCSGDAFLVTVRNKKRVGYTYELTLKVKGEWVIKEEKKMVKGNINIPEFSFGELDELEMEVKLTEEKDILQQDRTRIIQDLKLFMQPVRERLLQFEQELKDR